MDADGEPIKPDLVRVADLIPNFDNIGLLEQVSEQDLLETDLYVFRESTGELVVEKLNFARFGELTETPKNSVDEQSSVGYFELTIPGQDAGNSFRNLYRDRSLYKDYEDWQASYGVQESLQGRAEPVECQPLRYCPRQPHQGNPATQRRTEHHRRPSILACGGARVECDAGCAGFRR